MKALKNLSLSVMISAILLTQTSCIGSFSLTNSIYDWNNNLGDKYVNALVFAALVIIPAYGVALFIDGIVLNTIEFWSGQNPVSMNEGEFDTQIVEAKGSKYRVTATKNKFIAEAIEGKNKGELVEFIFSPEDKSWSIKKGEFEEKLVSINTETNKVKVYHPGLSDDNFFAYSLQDLAEASN